MAAVVRVLQDVSRERRGEEVRERGRREQNRGSKKREIAVLEKSNPEELFLSPVFWHRASPLPFPSPGRRDLCEEGGFGLGGLG